MVLLIVFIALFMLLFGMSMVFMVYTCVIWSLAMAEDQQQQQVMVVLDVKKAGRGGLTEVELERLGGTEDGRAVKGSECVVCLEEIEEGQVARVLPDCHHAFHRACADRWLLVHSDCPICRARLLPPPPDDDLAAPPSVTLEVVIDS